MYEKKSSGSGKVSGNHSPMGKLTVEKSTTPISSGISKERHYGITIPKTVTRSNKRG